MKRIILFIGALVFLPALQADMFSEQLIYTPAPRNEIYYKLLPQTNEHKATITFIKSRRPELMSLEEPFLKMVHHASGAAVFLETGTYKGDTTKSASKLFFVHSIELSKPLYQKAKKRFTNDTNIKLYQGDSAVVIPRILEDLQDKAVIFLDAHFSQGETAQGETNTSIMAELAMIKESGITNAFIIVDDMRMFYQPITDVTKTFIEGYPTANNVVDALLEINPDYQCAFVYDTLLAFPAADNVTVSPLVKALTMSRLYDETNYTIDDVIAAEWQISQAKDKEKEILIDLATRWVEKWSEQAGLSRHYSLWYGLLLLANEEYGKAAAYLQDAKKRGLTHWRIDWYIAMAQAQCFFGIR